MTHTSGPAFWATKEATLSTARRPPFQLSMMTAKSAIDPRLHEKARIQRWAQDPETVERRERPADRRGQQQVRQDGISANDFNLRKEFAEQRAERAGCKKLD